ncbi:hypothetical protein mru_1155 [Methanobrevibacter ruminantium M1]|uniref:Uncharacterized protein n=1 Tax=Methanobrevibacter ruminantium (strain ATCC 35063 / DSM 1093 / JCM 13430 / OCM 146 / M1) TaxID=634498 RepID=D3E394_METRM|nr:hypothetical protein [Methanobrevibacter ruminantium]ADC47005.1 hypothetical protein mru_1155 [Methanobrevibacter ruminantium M1]
MNNKTRMVVGRHSKRTGPEMDQIVEKYYFFEEGFAGLMMLFEEDWFVDKLLELKDLVLEHYDDVVFYFFNLTLKSDLESCCFLVTVIVKKDDGHEMSKSHIRSLISDRINDGSKLPFMINLVEVSDPLEFKRYTQGEIGPHKD